ncbi:MAG: glycogen/starch/alpha-glucan phosphorylase [Streptococcus salivarius]
MTLFLYPDDSTRKGELLRIYQQYFMVSNAAQLLIDEAIERGSNFTTFQITLTYKSTILTHQW